VDKPEISEPGELKNIGMTLSIIIGCLCGIALGKIFERLNNF